MTNQDTDIKPVILRGVRIYPAPTFDSLIDFATQRGGILIAVNAEKMSKASDKLKALINENIGYCDGSGLVLASKQKGIDHATKIAGCELWLKIIERHHQNGRFYIIGGQPDVHADTISKLQSEYPDLNIVGHRDGYLKSESERQALIDDIAATKPDFVFVAMGSPKQEFLMADMLKRHHALYQGLGGSFDVYTGRSARAPKWWIDHNAEFVYRLIKQPSRIKRDIVRVKFAWWLLTHQF